MVQITCSLGLGLLIFIASSSSVSAQNAVRQFLSSGNIDPLGGQFATPANIIFELLKYVLVFSGLILFFMLIAGGFQLMFGAGSPKQAEAGKTRITHALVGFIIIFASYWITQIVEVVLGINIL